MALPAPGSPTKEPATIPTPGAHLPHQESHAANPLLGDEWATSVPDGCL